MHIMCEGVIKEGLILFLKRNHGRNGSNIQQKKNSSNKIPYQQFLKFSI